MTDLEVYKQIDEMYEKPLGRTIRGLFDCHRLQGMSTDDAWLETLQYHAKEGKYATIGEQGNANEKPTKPFPRNTPTSHYPNRRLDVGELCSIVDALRASDRQLSIYVVQAESLILELSRRGYLHIQDETTNPP